MVSTQTYITSTNPAPAVSERTDKRCRTKPAKPASCRVGFEVVIVHAVDLDAVAFYARFGFTRFVGHDRHLFMTTKTLLASFAR